MRQTSVVTALARALSPHRVGILTVLGLLCIAVAAGGWDWRAGVATLGVGLIVTGWLVEPDVNGQRR